MHELDFSRIIPPFRLLQTRTFGGVLSVFVLGALLGLPAFVGGEATANEPPPNEEEEETGSERHESTTATSIENGLRWLASTQEEDGSWNSEKHGGHPLYNVGDTSLALLAFLHDGQTHRDGPYRENVQNAIEFLLRSQDSEGCFGPRVSQNFMYSHILATQACGEAYRLTEYGLYRGAVKRGLEFLENARNPYRGWRYGIRTGDNDSSVTSWALLALDTGRRSGFDVSDHSLRQGRKFLEEMTGEDGRTGYNQIGTGSSRIEDRIDLFPTQETECLTAMSVVGRIASGVRPLHTSLAKSLDQILARIPTWEKPSIDMTYWYFGSLAMHLSDHPDKQKWRRPLSQAIVNHQIDSGDLAGSWNPEGAWGPEGGRVYSTALMTICLSLTR